MKRVVLIGDSIRQGYQGTVRLELSDSAEVWAPETNGGHSVNVLMNLWGWVIQRDPDVVHLNCGLHDLREISYRGRENVVPVTHYRANVETILRTIREHTHAKILWATCTPVHEARAHAAHALPNRYEADVVAYNNAALEVCERLGIPVNDLFSVVMNAGKDKWLSDDGGHFTPEGSELLGKSVAAFIRTHL